jgi:uncharacterized protein YcbK (DUF882 family)
VRARLLLLACVISGRAGTAAAEPTKKEELLAKSKEPAPATWDRQLAKKIGKPPPPVLNLRNIWTKETFAFEPKKGVTAPEPVLSAFLRCHFTGEPNKMDARLFGVLVSAALHFDAPRIDIVSGFRAPKYNLMLRKKGHEVARDSQHTYGTAVDFRIPGVATTRLLEWARGLRLGGVGFYPDSQFVHVDTGPVRYWEGK